MLGHRLDAVAVRSAAQARDAQRRVAQRRGLRAFWQGNPYFVGQLRADFVPLQRAEQAQHGLGHALAHLDQRLVLGHLGVGQRVQTAPQPVQLARLVQPNQKLRRPAVFTHIRRPQHAPVPGQFEDVVGLVHGRIRACYRS